MGVRAAVIAEGRRAPGLRADAFTIVQAVLGFVVLALWAEAFVGLDASSYWADELWTLFVANHGGGPAEVLRRALADNQPPAFYLAMNLWISAWGASEAATRMFSALCAVGASALFLAGSAATFSRPARLFAAAAGASSAHWFVQSQNARGYALGMLLLVGLLVCGMRARRECRTGATPGWALCAAIAVLGFVAAFTHYYMLVTVGLVYLALLVTIPALRVRLTVLIAGAVTLAASLVLIVVQHRNTQVGFQNTWFSNDAYALQQAFMGAGRAAVGRWSKRALLLLGLALLYGVWRPRPARSAGNAAELSGRDWIAGLSLFVLLGVTAVGLATSFLFAPSLSERNLLVPQPCLWVLAAWMFDAATARLSAREAAAAALAAAGLIALELIGLKGRVLQRNEDWRGSAEYVSRQPACRGEIMPVVLPRKFGPDTPFFRAFAERDLFGHYYRGGGRLAVLSEAELAGRKPSPLSGVIAARARGGDPCPVLAWAVHDMDDVTARALAQALAQRPEIRARVRVLRMPSMIRDRDSWRPDWPAAYVFERAG